MSAIPDFVFISLLALLNIVFGLIFYCLSSSLSYALLMFLQSVPLARIQIVVVLFSVCLHFVKDRVVNLIWSPDMFPSLA